MNDVDVDLDLRCKKHDDDDVDNSYGNPPDSLNLHILLNMIPKVEGVRPKEQRAT